MLRIKQNEEGDHKVVPSSELPSPEFIGPIENAEVKRDLEMKGKT